MRRFYHIWLLIVLFCLGCGWHLRPADSEANEPLVTIDRYDQTERLFLSTGDYAALQQNVDTVAAVQPIQAENISDVTVDSARVLVVGQAKN